MLQLCMLKQRLLKILLRTSIILQDFTVNNDLLRLLIVITDQDRLLQITMYINRLFKLLSTKIV